MPEIDYSKLELEIIEWWIKRLYEELEVFEKQIKTLQFQAELSKKHSDKVRLSGQIDLIIEQVNDTHKRIAESKIKKDEILNSTEF